MATKDKTVDVVVYEKKVSVLVTESNSLVLKTPEDMTRATDLLSQMNQIIDAATEEKERMTKPLNAALAVERGRWKPFEALYKPAVDALREKMGSFQAKLLKEQAEEQAKIVARGGDGKGHFKDETVMKKLGEVATVDKKILSSSGSVKFRVDKILKVVNLEKVPREYLVLDEKKALDDLKKGLSINGLEIEEKQVVLNSR